MWEKIKYSKP